MKNKKIIFKISNALDFINQKIKNQNKGKNGIEEQKKKVFVNDRMNKYKEIKKYIQ